MDLLRDKKNFECFKLANLAMLMQMMEKQRDCFLN